MDNEQVLNELLQLLERIDIKVKYDRGNFKGGLIRYKDETVLYINRREEVENKIALIVSELSRLNIPDDKLPEHLKHIIKNQQPET